MIPSCTLVLIWGWEGRAWQGEDSLVWAREEQWQKMCMDTLATTYQIMVGFPGTKSADKKGLALGEKQQLPALLLFLVPGKHNK